MRHVMRTRQSRQMTFLETSWTLAEAKATAVSAMISAWIEPRPPVTLRCQHNTSTQDTLHKPRFYLYLSGWPCSSMLQNNEIRSSDNGSEFQSVGPETLLFLVQHSGIHSHCMFITNNDSVLCTSTDCVIPQSIQNTNIAPTWHLGCKYYCVNTNSLTYLLTYRLKLNKYLPLS